MYKKQEFLHRAVWRCCLLVLIFICAAPWRLAFAIEERELVQQKDEKWSYRYLLETDLGFYATVEQNETTNFAILVFDEGLTYEVYRDGVQILYENEQILMNTGDYRVVVYNSSKETFGTLRFTVENAVDSAAEEFVLGELITNAPLTVGYDTERRMYSFQFPNGVKFYGTVPNGAVATNAVKFEVPNDILVTVFENDKVNMDYGNMIFGKEGMFRLNMLVYTTDMTATDVNTYQTEFSFRITNGILSDMKVMNAPEGFTLAAAEMNGVQATPSAKDYHILERDGRYHFRFASEGGVPDYEVWFEIDTVAPFLYFSDNADLKKSVSETVTFTRSEADSLVRLYRDSIESYAVEDVLISEGRYSVTVSDTAGNERSYKVTIRRQVQIVDYRVVIIFAVLGVGLIAYMVFTRRNMRIL